MLKYSLLLTLVAGLAAVFNYSCTSDVSETVGVWTFAGEGDSLSLCQIGNGDIPGYLPAIDVDQVLKVKGDSIVTPQLTFHKDQVAGGVQFKYCNGLYSAGICIGGMECYNGLWFVPDHTVLFTGSRYAINNVRDQLRQIGLPVTSEEDFSGRWVLPIE